MNVDEIIRKWALKNAVDHNGKAVVGAVISKVLGELPEYKSKVKELVKDISKIVSDVNSISLEEQIAELKEKYPELLEKKEEKKGLPELPNAEMGKVITCFPPDPSKYPHLGHAKAALVNYEYAKKYNGKFILRFEDTNMDKVKLEYYEQMKKDLSWLGISWSYVDYITDHMEEIYSEAENLIKKGLAYACDCPVEVIRKNRAEKKACACRNRSVEENLEIWKKMLSGELEEGSFVIRAKIDMQHKNAAMRDPNIMRIVKKPHPRVGDKYKVWPLYDFATVVMDKIEGITHRIRTKEFEMHKEMQEWIREKIGGQKVTVIEFARFNMEGVPSSGRIIREKIANGEYIGWDDPRLTTLLALRKRGFLPEAIKEFLIETGLTKTEATLSWDKLEAKNRELLDPIAPRYFAVLDEYKVKLKVKNLPKLTVKIPNHPTNKELGFREYSFDEDSEFYVDKRDFEKGKKFRLMEAFNIDVKEVGKEIMAEFDSVEYKEGFKIIHWVEIGRSTNAKVMMLDANYESIVAEDYINNLEEDDKIQFVRFGFVRLNNKKEKEFRFTHK